MAASEDVDVRLRLQGAVRFNHEANQSARAIDNIGDQAAQAARKIARFNAASSKTRINIGPLSTSMRGGAIAVGALTVATGKVVPVILSAAEAVATLAGGAGAAGGVGMLALGQAAGVASLGLGNLSKALGGNAEAARSLSPEVRDLFDMLSDKKQVLAQTAQDGMLPGLSKGAKSASRNFHVLRRIVGDTSKTLGGLAEEAGARLGSKSFGRDLKTVGAGNVKIIGNLGHAGLHLAGALQDVLVEATPLAVWLSKMAENGARFVETWADSARASGKMAKFFREARKDLTLLGSMTGHAGRGLINLFGAQDVDGTKTLKSLDTLTARFERWTKSPAVQKDVGDAIIAQIPKAVGALMTGIAESLPGAAARGAEVFVKSFLAANAWGKLAAGVWLTKKLGGFGALKNLMASGGAGGGTVGRLLGGARGATPTTPLYVFDVSSTKPGKSLIDKVGKVGLGALTATGAFATADALVLAERNKAARQAGVNQQAKPTGSFVNDTPANIAIGTKITDALGLTHFRDHGAQQPVVHVNLQSPNVLLDGVPLAHRLDMANAKKKARSR